MDSLNSKNTPKPISPVLPSDDDHQGLLDSFNNFSLEQYGFIETTPELMITSSESNDDGIAIRCLNQLSSPQIEPRTDYSTGFLDSFENFSLEQYGFIETTPELMITSSEKNDDGIATRCLNQLSSPQIESRTDYSTGEYCNNDHQGLLDSYNNFSLEQYRFVETTPKSLITSSEDNDDDIATRCLNQLSSPQIESRTDYSTGEYCNNDHQGLLDSYNNFSLEQYGFVETTPKSLITSSEDNDDDIATRCLNQLSSPQIEPRTDYSTGEYSMTCDKNCYKCVPFMCRDLGIGSYMMDIKKYPMCPNEDCYKCLPDTYCSYTKSLGIGNCYINKSKLA